eukprot:XP_011665300.1 PREDICTED: uncharacterized protein LOC105438774 [Strongylocentrotus purpuratus]
MSDPSVGEQHQLYITGRQRQAEKRLLEVGASSTGFDISTHDFFIVTGSMKTLLIADESSLETTNFTGKKVLIHDVNDGFKPAPLYNIELSSGLVSGPVTVGIVTKLPMRGISMLLGNDLAGSKVLPSPVVCVTPVVTEKLESEVPVLYPSCVVTRAQAMKKKEDDTDGVVNLGDTFSRTLEEGHAKTIFSQPVLIEAQKAAEDLKKLYDVAVPAGEAGKVSQSFTTKCGVLMSKPVLDAPNFQNPFQLAADTSDVGVGGVLLQIDDMGLLKPISYFSKKLNPHQRRYSTIEKECLGLVLPAQHFNVYLSNSSEVTVFTDREAGIAVLAGQNTTLPCIFEGMPWHVNWLKEDGPSWNGIASYGDNTNYGTIDDGKYSVQEHFSSGKSSFSLSIAEVEIADDGRYRCAVTDNYGTSSSSLYHLEVLDALNTSVTTPALHGSTPTTPTSTQTVTTTTTDSRDQTVDDTGSGISLAAKFGIAFGAVRKCCVR